jgi:hypothetical protein
VVEPAALRNARRVEGAPAAAVASIVSSIGSGELML